jgi:catechol 2,3-dioxygenase-like lactoylglutathione lyase family enzyme
MKLAFDCIFYYVSDIERAIRFYTDILGFKVSSKDYVARFDIDGVLFEVVPTTDKSKLGGAAAERRCNLSTTEGNRRHAGVAPRPGR